MAKQKCNCETGLALDQYGKLSISTGNIEINYDAYSCDSSWFEQIPINYCPICGKKFNP